MSNSFYHKELTDAQWNRIKALFPEEKKVGRKPLNPRKVFDGIFWILKSGARWRDLPPCYGTAFITNSVFGVLKVFLNVCSKLSTAIQIIQPCLSLIRRFVKSIKVLVRV